MSNSIATDLQWPLPVVAHWLRQDGTRLATEAIRASARDAWLWIGRDPYRGPVQYARLAIDAASAANVRAPCIDALADAQIVARRSDGILISGHAIDLSHVLTWAQRRQSWWCVLRPMYAC